MTRTFAIVYETATQDIRRLIDTSDDPDDSHLERVKKYLAPDETMEIFRQADFPVRFPRFVKPFIGQGAVIDKAKMDAPVDATKLADLSASAVAFVQQETAKETAMPLPGPGLTPAQKLIFQAQQAALSVIS